MNQKETGTYRFISEKTKRKPINKRRLLKRLCAIVAAAVVFGSVASVVFTIVQPKAEQWTQVQDSVDIVIEMSDTVGNGQTTSSDTGKEILGGAVSVTDVQRVYYDLYSLANTQAASLVKIIIGTYSWDHDESENLNEISGIIISEEGRKLIILTEQESLQNVKNVTVEFFNGDTALGTVENYDEELELGAISVNIANVSVAVRKALKVAEFGNSKTVTKGMFAVAVGRPLGDCYSSIVGTIVDTDDSLSYVDAQYSILKTDIPAKSYSGGFLMDRNGKIIGILTHAGDEKGENNTLSAIPISDIKTCVENIANEKAISYLGLYIDTVTEKEAKQHGIAQGVYVRDVEFNSPAMQGGIRAGDVIVKMGANEIGNVDKFRSVLDKYVAGQKVNIVVMRYQQEAYKEVTLEVTIGKRGN